VVGGQWIVKGFNVGATPSFGFAQDGELVEPCGRPFILF